MVAGYITAPNFHVVGEKAAIPLTTSACSLERSMHSHYTLQAGLQHLGHANRIVSFDNCFFEARVGPRHRPS